MPIPAEVAIREHRSNAYRVTIMQPLFRAKSKASISLGFATISQPLPNIEADGVTNASLIIGTFRA